MTGSGAGDRRTEVALGVLTILFYSFHGGYYVVRRQEENLLWFCHLAALAVGVALVARSPTLNAVGFLWLTVGVPLWLFYLATGGELMPGSVLTHVGGLLFGLFGLRRLGLPQGAWWKALVALTVVHLLTRLVTPPAENVNLAFAVWPGWEGWFPSHGAYVLCLAALSAVVFLGVSQTLVRVGFARPTPEERR